MNGEYKNNYISQKVITPYKSSGNATSAGRRMRKSRESRQMKNKSMAEIKLNVHQDEQQDEDETTSKNENKPNLSINLDIISNGDCKFEM